jgi:membrane protease YdiL (CAAX protease family)
MIPAAPSSTAGTPLPPEPPGTTDRRALFAQLGWFVAITFGSSFAIAWLTWSRGGLAHFPGLPLAMLCPMLAAFFVQRAIAREPVFRRGQLGLRAGHWRDWVILPVAAAAVIATILGLTFLLHPALLADQRTIAANVDNLRAIPGGAQSVGIRLLLAYGITLIVAPVLNIPIFFGEEIGWRGFMTPRLVKLFGKPGMLIAGVIWALWHTPFILLGLDYPAHPVLGHLIWIPVCVAGGTLLQGVVTRSRSVVPAALCHGVVNQLATLTLSVFAVEPRFRDLVDGPSGVVALLILAPPAWYVYRRLQSADIIDAVGPPRASTGRSKPRAC